MSIPQDDYDEAIYHVPKQKRPTLKDMGASVSVFPPLGQVTQVQKETVPVTALLEVPNDAANQQADQPWEVALWHAAGDDNWTETLLASTQKVPSTLHKVNGQVRRFWFDGQLSVKSLVNFTVKFRSGPDKEWKWIRDEQSAEDGAIILNSDSTVAALPDDFSEILQGYDSDIKVTSCPSQCPGTKLWSLAANVDAANGEDSTYRDVSLGLPWGGFLR